MSVFKKNGNYWIDFYLKNGRRKREKIGPNWRLAQAVLAKRKVEVAENKYLDVKKEKKIKFRDFAVTFMENHSKPNKKSWRSSDEKYLRNLVPEFGEKYLYEIDSIMIEQYKAERKKTVSAASVNREVALLKCMFNRAIDWNLAYENPAKKVKLFQENNTRLRYLEKDEIKKLLEVCSPGLRSLLILALNTGMRKSEMRNLRWPDVDIKRGIITLRDTKNGEMRHISK